jgi:uncharacterized membrane protein
MSLTHIQEHVDIIAKHEQEFLASRTAAERLSDVVAGFVGSFPFVFAHLGIFAAWILLNTLPGVHHWDARPFPLLQTCVAMEAILVASFILMRQARLGRRSDERDHLMLQILLLSEKEITAVLGIDRQIARQVGLTKEANATEVLELSQQTSIEDVAQTIKETITEEKVAAVVEEKMGE